MHTVTFAYPEKASESQREDAFKFLFSVAKMLPCKMCREEWMAFLVESIADANSHHLSGRNAFSRFLVDGHNRVNLRLGKPQMSYQRVKDIYLYPPKCVFSKTIKPLIVITIVAIAFLLYNRSSKTKTIKFEAVDSFPEKACPYE